jgi:hypothetical protein
MMLRLFYSIFGDEKPAQNYPKKLVQAAIERAVDGTDPSLRGLLGYNRKLRPAVLHAIDHVVDLVDNLEDALELSQKKFGKDPLLRLFFISSQHVGNLLESDPMLTEFREEAGHAGKPAWALLSMECEQRQSFGVAQQGGTISRDVPFATVSMAAHRLLDLALDLVETKRLLKRRAFDHLLTLALSRIAAVQGVRKDLMNHRTLLQSKLEFLQRGRWGFGGFGREVTPQAAELQQKLDEIQIQLSEVGGDDRYLEKNLEILVDVLGNAEKQIWTQPLALIVDRMGIRRNKASADAPELMLTEIHNNVGRRLVVRLVMVPPKHA